jgi:hypothetical protein
MPIKRLLLAVSLLSCTFVVATTPTHALAEPTYIIDPSLSALEQADAATIRNAITKAANEYGYTGFTAVIYAPTLNGANWAFNELAKISCPLGSVENLASGTAIADLSLGRCIVFKATPISYPNVAKNAESVAYHEVFHLAQAIRGGSKPMGARIDDMRWIYEGTAEIGGYQPQLSSGKLTQNSLIALLRDSAMNTSSSLTQISNAWVDDSIALVSIPFLRSNAMYSRSYLAAHYLTTITSNEKVMKDYFAEAGRLGDHVAAFTSTFGMTVSEFDAKFSSWIGGWTAPSASTTKANSPQRSVKIGGSCSVLNATSKVGGKKVTCKRVAKRLTWTKS